MGVNFSGIKTTVIQPAVFHQDEIITETDSFLATAAKQKQCFFFRINQQGFAGNFDRNVIFIVTCRKIWAVFSYMPITTKNGLFAHPSQMTHKATPTILCSILTGSYYNTQPLLQYFSPLYLHLVGGAFVLNRKYLPSDY